MDGSSRESGDCTMSCCMVSCPELDASAEEKEIIDLTARLISVIAAKDIKEYS